MCCARRGGFFWLSTIGALHICTLVQRFRTVFSNLYMRWLLELSLLIAFFAARLNLTQQLCFDANAIDATGQHAFCLLVSTTMPNLPESVLAFATLSHTSGPPGGSGYGEPCDVTSLSLSRTPLVLAP